MEITYRNAILEDVNDIADLSNICFGSDVDFDIQTFKEEYFNNIADKKLIVATTDNIIVGMALANVRRKVFEAYKYLYLDNICVHPDYRKRGIGTYLVMAFDEYAKENDCKYITFTSSDKRKEAHSVYKNCGYDIVSNVFKKEVE